VTGGGPPVAGGAGTGPATILIVDDERPIREMLALALRGAGHRVVEAVHGRQALDLVARERPDLVVSDVMMPLLGGVELCRRLKADPATAAIPVVLMSAAGAHLGRGAGADAVVAKPFDLDALDALVQRLLRSGVAGGTT
jgi:CheY-like chemotaxis protein